MPDIKTRDTVKGTIKTLDKAAVAGERMKEAYVNQGKGRAWRIFCGKLSGGICG